MPKILNNIPLTDFLAIALGTASYVSIPSSVAEQIAAIDADEQYCHIEWPTEKAERPHLWNIDEWRTSYARHQRRKGLSERERKVAVRFSELRSELTRKIMFHTGGTEQQLQTVVDAVIRTRNTTGALAFGVDITELLQLDDELRAFKEVNKFK